MNSIHSRPPLVAVLFVCAAALANDSRARVDFEVGEGSANSAVPCRIHLKNTAGEPERSAGLPFWRDHFVCPGTARLELAPGEYTYEIERGPEYRAATGSFTAAAGEQKRVAVTIERIANLAADGWWSGELHVHRPPQDVELLMKAEDLHVAPVITWWNNRNLWENQPPPDEPLVRFDGDRYSHLMGGEDEREGGALLFFNLRRSLAITGASREYPSPMQFVADARRASNDVWIDIEKPFWWDVPVWLASGQVDSIGIANNHMCRGQMYETEAWGRPRDAARLPPPLGNGFWTQEIYYHILNSGIRLPPSAGSASGVLPNPVGYNRVYVHLGDRLDHDAWWSALRAGRSFVTNGPLLNVRMNGELPGQIFKGPAGAELRLDVSLRLISRDPIYRIEIIQNGRIVHTVTGADWSAAGAATAKPLGSVRFTESGWTLIRAIAENPKTFRFASTAPSYVEIGDSQHRISRSSAQFFRDWLEERVQRIKLDDAAQRREVIEHHERARQFWSDRLAASNAP